MAEDNFSPWHNGVPVIFMGGEDDPPPVPDPVVPPAPAPQPDPPAPEPTDFAESDDFGNFRTEADGGRTYEDGYRITADDRHFDANGVEIPADPDPAAPPPPPAAPAVAAAPPQAAAPVPPQPTGQQQVPTWSAIEQNLRQQWAADAQLQSDFLVNPVEANLRIQGDIQRAQHVHRGWIKQKERTELAALQAEAPELYARYEREVREYLEELAPDARVQPNSAIQTAISMAIRDLGGNLSTLNSLVKGEAPAVAAPVVPKQPLPPDQRPPRAPSTGATRRRTVTRAPRTETDALNFYRNLYPGASDEDLSRYSEFAAGSSNNGRR